MAMRRRWEIKQPDELHVLQSAQMQAISWIGAYLGEAGNPRNLEIVDAGQAFLKPERLKQREALYLASANDPAQHMRVATNHNDRVLGLLYGTQTPNQQELQSLYVDPEYFGTGVAIDLVEDFIDWSDPERPIELSVVDDNYRAQAFYRRMGFTAVEAPPRPVKAFGKVFKHLYEIDMVREV